MKNRELFYIDENGEQQDAELWDEILGDDTQNTHDISAPETPAAAVAKSKIEQLRNLFRG